MIATKAQLNMTILRRSSLIIMFVWIDSSAPELRTTNTALKETIGVESPQLERVQSTNGLHETGDDEECLETVQAHV